MPQIYSFPYIFLCEKLNVGTSLAVQGLRLCASNTEGMNSVPGWSTERPHAEWHGQKKKNPEKVKHEC